MQAITEDDIEKQLFGDSDHEVEPTLEDGYNDSDFEDADKVKGRKRGKKVKRVAIEQEKPRRQRKRVEESLGKADSGSDSEEDTSSPAYQAKKDFERALQVAMPGRRRKLTLDDEIEMDKMASELREQMLDAAEQDITLRESSKPAIKKLALLPKVIGSMTRKDIQESLLDGGILAAVKVWLEPYEDGSLPLLDIRTNLLESLDTMPIEKHHLKESGLGRIVMYLYKYPLETKENKKLASRLIDKWSRPISGQTHDYRHLAQTLRGQDSFQTIPQSQISSIRRSKDSQFLEMQDPMQARYKKIASIAKPKTSRS
jgi:transcription factor SPN1